MWSSEVRRLGAGEVVAVVNTHQHFDHTFGNVVFTEEYDGPPVYAHDEAATGLAVSGPAAAAGGRRGRQRPAQRRRRGGPGRAAHRDVLLRPGRRPRRPARGAGAPRSRAHRRRRGRAGRRRRRGLRRRPGRGVRATLGVPGFGDDCFPMEWPATLDLLIGLLTPDSVVVPGHGLPVGKDFVDEQRGAIGVVAETHPRPGLARRTGRRRTGRDRVALPRASSSCTPYDAATSTCRAARGTLPLI